MTDIAGAQAAGGSSACWNCGQPLRAGTAQCLWCGVAQQQSSQPTQFLVPPGGAPVPGVAASIPPAPPSAPQAPQAAAAYQPPKPARVRGAALDASFSGTAAGVGAQVLALSIDVVLVAVVAVSVGLLSGNLIFAGLAVLELAIFFWVLEARTGATVGTAIMGLRASRDDAPFSPGIGRAFVRRLVTGVGFLAGGVGAWVVAASAAWDREGKNRSWADVAAHTQLVAVPPRTRTPAPAAAPQQPGAPQQPAAPAALQYPPTEAPIVLAAPHVVSTLARPTPVNEDSASQSRTGAPEAAFSPTPPVDARVQAAPASEAPAAGAPTISVPESADGTLLLVFDTGQREQFATPVAVNLGRNPVATEPTDALVTVTDPDSTVSKTHLRLEHSRGRTWVTDGGSTNGTDLLEDDGDVIALTPGNRVLVEEGVRVRMGNRAFTISLILGGEK